MKKTILIVVATTGLAVGALAQGTIALGNIYGLPPHPAVDNDTLSNHYTGTLGIEVWALNATAVPPGINLSPEPGSGVVAYDAMRADGFALQASLAGVPASSGSFGIGTVILPTIPGPEAVLAMAVWNTSAPSWAAMLAGARSDTRAGVIAFVNPVSVLALPPLAPARLTGWTADLVMTAIPEPSVLTVASLGGALLLLLRPRDWGFQDDNTWAEADTNYFYYAWCDRSGTYTGMNVLTNNPQFYSRPDADVKLAKIRQ